MVDDEPRAEIYAAASKKDQAMVMFRDAVAMVDQSPGLNKRIQRSGGNPVWNLAYLERGSFFRPISSEKGQSGPRPHFALCDEVHEHANRDTLEMLERGFKFRRQPLLVLITNSGFDKTTVCGEEHDHAVKVAHGEVEDDNTFSYVCALDDGDDPLENPECWVKANPLLGVTITEKYLSDVVAQAKAIPGKRNNILRLHFCVWTDADSAWIGKETWLACEADVDIEEMRCRVCYGGLDLSQKRDLTAFAVVCPTPDGKFDAFVEFWTPGDTIKEREDIDRVPYRVWKDEGHLTAVPGKAVDYGFVAHRLGELSGEYEILSVAYDRWQIDLLRKELDAEGVDLKLVECGQGFRDMSKALDALEDAILNGKLRVKTNPVLRWNAACTTLQTDAAGNRKFTKQKSIGRIDGIVALAMAMKAAVECENPRSVYEERGIITL
jgi:phage terminase large subunit-like protein